MDPEGGQIVGPDLGGAILDLEGGTYSVSRPVRFPTLGGGNMWVRSGTLRARTGFRSDCTTCSLVSVVELLGWGRYENYTKLAFGYINFFAVTIDANGLTLGGLKITHSSGIHITQCNIVGFSSIGILASGGFIDIVDSYVGTNRFPGEICPHTYKDHPHWMNGTAVVLEDNDSYMSGCYIHCVGLGLEIQGSVNTIINTHFATNWVSSSGMYACTPLICIPPGPNPPGKHGRYIAGLVTNSWLWCPKSHLWHWWWRVVEIRCQ